MRVDWITSVPIKIAKTPINMFGILMEVHESRRRHAADQTGDRASLAIRISRTSKETNMQISKKKTNIANSLIRKYS